MIPERFCLDYPSRVSDLLNRLAPLAEQMDLSTTFILSLAMPMLVIPFERLKSGHLFSDSRFDSTPHRELDRLMRSEFQDTPFWWEPDRAKWRFAYVVDHADDPSQWKDLQGQHPLKDRHRSSAAEAQFEDIVFTMRHGLSHGCVVYLDENGEETPRRRVTQIAFASKVGRDQARELQLPDGTRRLVAVEEQALRSFLSAWCSWLQGFQLSSRLKLAA